MPNPHGEARVVVPHRVSLKAPALSRAPSLTHRWPLADLAVPSFQPTNSRISSVAKLLGTTSGVPSRNETNCEYITIVRTFHRHVKGFPDTAWARRCPMASSVSPESPK